MTKNSKNKCPWCGGREWECWYILGANDARPSDLFRSLVDLSDSINAGDDFLTQNGHVWVDECTTCGCVVS